MNIKIKKKPDPVTRIHKKKFSLTPVLYRTSDGHNVSLFETYSVTLSRCSEDDAFKEESYTFNHPNDDIGDTRYVSVDDVEKISFKKLINLLSTGI